MRTFGKIIKYALLCLFGLFLLALAALFLFEQPVPDFLLRRITRSLSGTNYLVRANSATFRFSRGLKINNLRVFDRRKTAAQPVISASCVDLALDLRHFPWSRSTMVKAVTITELKYPRLPDGYYIPDSIEFPGRPDFQEKDEPLVLDLPSLQPFQLTLVQPEILGVTPKKVVADSVSVTPGGIRMGGIHLDWPDVDAQLSLDGSFEFNLETQRVQGEVHGLARQHHIRPLLVALDITNSYAFIDSFTHVEKPVDAACAFDANLRNNDLHLRLGIHPVDGRYNNVPFVKADGTIDLRVFVRDTYQNAHIVVGPVTANLTDGSTLSGTVVYENTNDVGYVSFNDVRSTTSLSNALAVAGVLNDGTLDCLSLATPPTITLNGRLAVDPAHASANRLDGTLAFGNGTFFSIPLTNAATAFHMRGTDVSFSNAHAAALHGGNVLGEGRISIPGFKQRNASFSLSVRSDPASTNGIALTDIADTLGLPVGDRHGTIFGDITLSGPLQTNLMDSVCVTGRVECCNGHLAQMAVFAGLTDYLAKSFEGIASVVNQSRGTMDFSLTNGLFRTDNIRVEGGFFTIQAAGKYDIPKDDLNFTARVTLTKNEGFFATLAKPITWSFGNLTKILFDFTIRGSIKKPEWTYNKNPMNLLK